MIYSRIYGRFNKLANSYNYNLYPPVRVRPVDDSTTFNLTM